MNRDSFLTMIAVSEGTEHIGNQRGYNVIVGATAQRPHVFDSYAQHPNVRVRLPKLGISSTAAGRYQILFRYWLAYKTQLHLPDFSPRSQDLIAIQLIRECHALEDVDAGRFAAAVHKCRSRWASLPGAGYKQHENRLADLQRAYINAGGSVA